MKTLLFFDTETTSLESAEIIQLAVKSNKKDFFFIADYFGATKPIEFEAMETHHITEEKIKGLPIFNDTPNPKIIENEVATGSIFVAHNAEFDVRVFKNHNIEIPDYICTMKIAKHLFQKDDTVKKFGLQYLRYRFGVKVEIEMAHDAGDDVKVLEAVYSYLHEYAKQKGSCTDDEVIDGFLKITKQPLLIYRLMFGKHNGKTYEEVARIDRGYLVWMKGNADMMKDIDQAYTVNYYLSK